MVKNHNPCHAFIPEGSKCSNGMGRCCGILNCMRRYPALQYTYYEVYGMTHTNQENQQYNDLFKEATGIMFAEYHTSQYWGRTFVKRKNGIIEIKE